ncbi:MAG: hypothetical protein J6R47_06855 [Acholeplasmatales bacterium]|jgi:hypothetical protein|nr:hypothetical protein [Acholeplasmatales bacterium]
MIKYKEYLIKPNAEGGFILGRNLRKVLDKNGKETETMTNICYPSTLKACLTKISSLEFAKAIENEDLTLNEAIDRLDQINADIKKSLNGLIREEF